MNNSVNILQFSPFQSFVSPTFWHKLAEIKLDLDRLDDKPKPIWGYYTNRNAKGSLLEVDYTAFNSNFKAPKFCFKSHGTIYNKNTIEDFKKCDKNELLKNEGLQLLKDIKSEAVLEDPSLLARFFVLSFADLRNYSYYYWFAFPCPLTPTVTLERSEELQEQSQISCIIKDALKADIANFFILQLFEGEYKISTLKELVLNFKDELDTWRLESIYFCFADNSEYDYPSWLMRIYITFLIYKCPSLLNKTLQFLSVRYDNHMNLHKSRLWHIKQTELCDFDDMDKVKFVGWELNKNQKAQPRMVSMKDSMDPELLADNSINLNLKLMKWRMFPELNLDIMANTKCLLLGAGTLGCAVSRMLLGWGFKHISFVDNGLVRLGNPVRQYLYTYEDAVKGNVMKATSAANCMKQINPMTVSAGYVMQIPMPGHTVGESLKEQTEKDLNTLKDLVQSHDVIFLLTDSRESRWLPTVLGAAYHKIVINSALGFDSYLVQRHGSTKTRDANFKPQIIDNLKCIPGDHLGCYFCNDVTAPGNSFKERTLDQQCTVTRPGVSNIAASYAVELLVSLLQHPAKEMAPAYYATTTNLASGNEAVSKTPEGMLGVIPHSIRGLLCSYENILPASEKFEQCIACSEKVLTEFKNKGNEFLFKVFETAKYLEDLTGISEYKALNSEIIDFNDSDLELSDD